MTELDIINAKGAIQNEILRIEKAFKLLKDNNSLEEITFDSIVCELIEGRNELQQALESVQEMDLLIIQFHAYNNKLNKEILKLKDELSFHRSNYTLEINRLKRELKIANDRNGF